MPPILRHLRGLWGPNWLLPGGALLVYLAAIAGVGGLRTEHVVIVGLALALAYATSATRRLLLELSPYLLVAIGYDLVRYPRDALLHADSVLGCELRATELSLFPAGPGQTWQDWFAVHHHPALDLLFAVPYFVFVYVVLGYALYLYFVDRPRMRRFLWAYAIGNYIAFGLWLLLPAAPPWYLRAQGCAIDLAAAPDPAALARVDAWLGIGYFGSFYSRASSVFGAIPSMHCAYPVIGLLTAWRAASWRTRPLHLAYAASMAVAAVYLDHHWIIDVLAGWAVAAVSVWVAGWALQTRPCSALFETPEAA